MLCWVSLSLSRLLSPASAFLPTPTTIKQETEVPQWHPLGLVSCCVSLCHRLRISHFPLSPTSTLKNIWRLKCLWDEAILNLFVYCCQFFSPLVIVCNLLQRYEGCVPCPPNLPSWPPPSDPQRDFWETKSSLSLISKSCPCLTVSITDIHSVPRISATLFGNQRNLGNHVRLVMAMWLVRGCWG